MQRTSSLARRRLLPQLGLRLLIMLGVLGLLIAASAWPRSWQPGLAVTVWVNILFFVVLGAADQFVLAPVLDRYPLARTACIVLETLLFGWFFAPGRLKPASKILFFAHIGPFFAAVLGGALLVLLLQWWHRRQRPT